MTKTLFTLLALLLFTALQAQEATLRSLGYAIYPKNSEGAFVDEKKWIVQETHININESEKVVTFMSKGLLDSDPFNMTRKVFKLKEITSNKPGTAQTIRVFTGVDNLGQNCIIRLKPKETEFRISNGELQIEYADKLEVYNLRINKYKPIVGEG